MRFVLALAILAPAAAGAQVCDDAPLSRAAAALLASGARVTSDSLLEAARAAGSDAPVLDAVVIRDGDPARRARFLSRARARRGTIACGEARDGARWIVLAAPRAGRIDLDGSGALRVALEPGLRAARLYAQDADARIWQAPVRPGEPVALPPELVPPIVVQLVADGPDGPRPVAERRIGGGAEPLVPNDDRPLAARLATLRERAGAGALRPNRLLERVARDHAERVCREARVSHLAGGDPEARLARAGLAARHVGEAIARAEDGARAYAALLRSPSHRAALVDRRFTDVGLGLARGEGGACLVVLLAAWPRAVPR
ncbi:MAG TPA: CAP domain-containing protein [Sandaracinaceae bacterium]